MKYFIAAFQRFSSRTTLALSVVCLIVTCLGFVPSIPASAAQTDRVALAGHAVPATVKTLTHVGRLAPTKRLVLDLVLPLRNQSDLEDLLRRQADPRDALYGHYLTPLEFTDRFGPSLSDVSAVATFAQTQGLSVKAISDNRTIMKVSGPVRAVETAFGVTMQRYGNKNGRSLYAPDTPPTIPAALSGKLLAVVGLYNVGVPRAFSRRVHPDPSAPTALPDSARPITQLGASGNAGLSPTDVHTIYNLTGVASKGTGQTLALYELDTYTPSDIAFYENFYQLPSVALQNVGVAGFNTGSAPGGAAAEVTLDLELLIALAPGVSKIIVYEADGGSTDASFETASLDIFNKYATDDLAGVMSVSYGESEIDVTQAEASANNQALMQCQSQGQTVCVAAGDAGAYTDQSNFPDDQPNTSEPGSQPLVLSVGGTDLMDSANAPYTYVSETSWADPDDFGRGFDGTGGGGGISEYWTLPTYQAGSFNTTVNPQGSTTHRNVPDVSLYGDYDDGTGYDVYFEGGWGGYNGTSASSPLWAAFLTDVNQARAAAGKPRLGLANTAIYAVAKQPSKYATDFHDINDGSNNLFYNAVDGYDNSTGWGSFNGINLFNDLVAYSTAAPPTIASFTPTSGPVGTVITITGTNLNGVTAVRFHDASATVFSASAGGAQITVTVPTGALTGTITVTTPGGSVQTTVQFTVTASPPPTITSFSPASGTAGTSVTITGTNFTGAIAVKFNGTTATTFTVVSATTITATVPTGATSGSISVTTPGGTATTSSSFPVLEPPTAASFTPASGPVGTVITITGTHLNGATGVRFHDASATVFSANAQGTQLTVTVPTGALTGTITVTTPSGSVQTTAQFTVTTLTPTITSFTPTSGPAGTVVVITGTNFASTTGVKFNGVSASGSITSNTQLTVTVPAGATTGPIAVTTSVGTTTSGANYTVTTGGETISSFTPISGPAGTSVTITGTGFTGATAVTFAGASATFTVKSATQITATVPAAATSGPIGVTTPSGSAMSAQSYTVTF